MGDALADEVQRVLNEKEISVDVVIPVSRVPLNERIIYAKAFHLDTRYISGCCAELGSKTEPSLPGGVHQKSICRTNIHHAWPTDEVGGAQG